ncbi:hypothetical protein SAMN04515647_3325 [Cohaesibacter sp. ES.047]|uniref:hypothetical protein n=1 Tax=Cohaesibacter sp. ES.047 TaxID=1798205 RepID=UPI000BC06D4A|nr:hypothetical protein [Cohaesibacter sp. ES.047]SNY93052.1 hypothetical protein SAMN04515647_3325 [Cohaesibacter sp. ES.047]
MPITDLISEEKRKQSGNMGVFQNPLVRLLAINWLIGLVATIVIFSGLLITNAAGLQILIFESENPIVPMALLFFGLLITFCSVAMGAAVMSLPRDDL